MTDQQLTSAYDLAQEHYASLGVNTEKALNTLAATPISLHCWQGDDVAGFEDPNRELSGGIMTTGNHPGKARNISELRSDLDKAYSLLPGEHRLNLHAMYLDADKQIPRNEIQPEHFHSWVDWAKENQHGIDFNPSCFSHPLADEGFTLAHPDEGIRQFWIEHCIASRKIGAYFGKQLASPCVTNIWIPDGYKDIPADRKTPRERLKTSLDEVLKEKLNPAHNLDAVECKLFGLGSESYVVGSHEFYLAYALEKQTLLCLDAGHFHPTEVVSDKLSSVLTFIDQVLLHVSRGVRWDSDHVVTLSDELEAIMQEIIRGDYLNRVHIGLDFFDASINRVAAWVIGTRNAQKALLMALLEPIQTLKNYELSGDFSSRLALQEELKMMPFAAVWNYFCLRQEVPVSMAFMDEIKQYETSVLSKRV